MNEPAVVKWCFLERQSSLLLDHGLEQYAEIKGFGSLPLLALHRRTLLFGRKIHMYFLRIVYFLCFATSLSALMSSG